MRSARRLPLVAPRTDLPPALRRSSFAPSLALALVAAASFASFASAGQDPAEPVRVWEGTLTLPTYALAPRRPQSALPRDRRVDRVSLHDAGQPRFGARRPRMARVLPRERVPEGRLPPGNRRAHPVGRGQADQRVHVLRQPGHPAGPDRAPGGVDFGRYRVEPGSAGAHGHQLLPGERGRRRKRRRLGDSGDRRGRTEFPHRLGGAADAASGDRAARRGDPAVQPDRPAASLLLLEQHRLPPARRHPLHLPDVARHGSLRDHVLPLADERRGGHDPASELSRADLDLRLPVHRRFLRGLRLGRRSRHRPDRRPPGASRQEGLDLGPGRRRDGEPAGAHRRGRALHRSAERSASDPVRLRLAAPGADGLVGRGVDPGVRAGRRL